MWFAGTHSDIGGGNSDQELSDVRFDWMKDRAEGRGLAFDEGSLEAFIRPDLLVPIP